MNNVIMYSASILALSVAGVTSGLAQESSVKGGLEEIIVTAQKRAESIQATPVTVSAITQDQIQNTGFTNITDLQGLIPGITINKGQSSANMVHLSVRGISLQDTSKAFESGIGLVLDGVPIGTPVAVLLDPFDVERIEVLRGPQGTLFGRNTTGGALNIVRTMPDPNGEFAGRTRATVGNFGRHDISAMVSGPLIEGKLAAKAVVITENDSGSIYNRVLDKRQGDRKLADYNLTLNATPNERLSASLVYERMKDDSDLPPTINLFTPDAIDLPIPGYSTGANLTCFLPNLQQTCRPQLSKYDNVVEHPTDQPGELTLDALTLRANYDLDGITVVSITGWRDLKQSSFSYLDSTFAGYFPIQQNETYEQFSQELRFESNFNGPFQIIAGGLYFHSKFNITQITELDGYLFGMSDNLNEVILTNPVSYSARYLTDSYALFAQADYDITDKLSLILGLRQTWDRKKLDPLTLYGFGAGVPEPLHGPQLTEGVLGLPASQGSGVAKFNKLTPKAGIQYQVNDDFMVFASYSVGYNTGGFNTRAPSISLIGPYDPETLKAFEVGIKSDWLDRRLRVNISAFHNTMKDKQEDLNIFAGGVNGTTTVNAAKARYKGVEAEITALPVDGWMNSLAIGYLDTGYVDFTGDLGQGTADLSALDLRRTPKWTIGFISDYSFAVGQGTAGLNVAITHVDKFHTNILNDPRGLVPATTKIDLSARYAIDLNGTELKMIGFVKNVTDKHPYNGMFSGNLPGSFFEFAIPEPGRTYGLTLEVGF